MTTATDGKVLKQTKQVNTGDVLTTRLSDGWVESEVKSIKPVKRRVSVKPDNSSPVTYYTAAIPFFNKESSMPHLHSVIPRIFFVVLSKAVPNRSSAVPARP